MTHTKRRFLVGLTAVLLGAGALGLRWVRRRPAVAPVTDFRETMTALVLALGPWTAEGHEDAAGQSFVSRFLTPARLEGYTPQRAIFERFARSLPPYARAIDAIDWGTRSVEEREALERLIADIYQTVEVRLTSAKVPPPGVCLGAI